MSLQSFGIFVWSPTLNDYAPSAHPSFASPSQAREYAKGHRFLRDAEFIVSTI